MSEVVNQADECLLLFPLWIDRTAPCAKLMRELQSSRCIKWDHRIDLFYQDYTPLWEKDQQLLQELFHTGKQKHRNPPRNNNNHVLKRWKRYSTYKKRCLNPGGIYSWLICHLVVCMCEKSHQPKAKKVNFTMLIYKYLLTIQSIFQIQKCWIMSHL